MRTCLSTLALLLLASPAALADDERSAKYRSNGCEIERKYDDGKMESKVECKPRGFGGAYYGSGKEEFRQGPCKVKREWKRNGEYKEEVKCD